MTKTNNDFAWFSGILIESGKKIKFTQYLDLPQMKVGDWFNCLDKKDLEQVYCLKRIDNGVYFFRKVEYVDKTMDEFPFWKED